MKAPECPHCGSDDTEIVTTHPRVWGCYCNSCGKTFAESKPAIDRTVRRGEDEDGSQPT